ncbi:hypothetical protein C8R44DRAFT_741871 [Mycena epipterygia]|nr:hypothetical protein C8R44DRAFT_741871 [Mycena epipterygia]
MGSIDAWLIHCTTAEDDQDIEEPLAKSKQAKSKSRMSRSYAPPPINIDSESEPEAPAKHKAVPSTAKKVAAPGRNSTKLVAESASEDEEIASAEEASNETEFSDESSTRNFGNDDAPDEEEFLNEIITSKTLHAPAAKPRFPSTESGKDSDESHEIDNVAPMDGAPMHFTTQRARWAAGTSKDELHEAIADGLMSIPLAPHSHHSSTGSGWSSGMDLTIPDSEPESDAVIGHTNKSSLRHNKGLGETVYFMSSTQPKRTELETCRTELRSGGHQGEWTLPPFSGVGRLFSLHSRILSRSDFTAAHRCIVSAVSEPEVPQPCTKISAAHNSAIAVAAGRSELSWDRSTRLVLSAPNKDIGFTVQHPEVQLMLRGTINTQRMDLMINDFYPTMITRVDFIRPKMIVAADIHPSTIHVKQCLMIDPKFAAILAPIPLDRINIQCGDVKQFAVSIVISMYRLTDLTPAEINVRVEELFKDHRYIFPVNPIRTDEIVVAIPPRLHQAGRQGPDDVKHHRLQKPQLRSSPARHPKHPEAHKLVDSMVAMGATVIYAGPSGTVHDRTSARAVQTVTGSSATLISLVNVPDSD